MACVSFAMKAAACLAVYATAWTRVRPECFDVANEVETLGRGFVPVTAVAVGEWVWTLSAGNATRMPTRVVTNALHANNFGYLFVTLRTAAGAVLTVTADHIVIANNMTMRAADVAPGHELWTQVAGAGAGAGAASDVVRSVVFSTRLSKVHLATCAGTVLVRQSFPAPQLMTWVTTMCLNAAALQAHTHPTFAQWTQVSRAEEDWAAMCTPA